MAQYFDFGDQVGPLLQQALANVEQKRQFTERQAMEYMQIQEAANRFKEQIAEQKRQFDVSRTDNVNKNRADIINTMTDNYVDEDVVKALGIDPKRFKGYSEKDIRAPYENIYGEGAPSLPAGRYYERSTIMAAKEAIDRETALNKIMAQMPISLQGADQIPTPKTVTKNVVENKIELDLGAHAFPQLSVRDRAASGQEGRPISLSTLSRGERDIFLSQLQSKLPNFDVRSIREAIYVPQTGKLVATTVQGATDEQGNPIPVEQNQIFDSGEVHKFFSETYPKLLSSYNAMKSIDKQREEGSLIALGGRLQQIVAQYPQYASQIAPFAGWAERFQNEQAEFLMRLQQQRELSATSQQNIMLREAAKHDPAIQEELANRARLLLEQQQLTR